MTMTAGDIKDMLHKRYNGGAPEREGEQYVCLEEARAGAGFAGNGGACDFLAIDTWASRGHEVIGHEIKVSLSDWKRELKAPEKAETFIKICRRFYVVVPAELAKKMAHEVPPTWGLLVCYESGRIVEKQKPTPKPGWKLTAVPASWWIGWLASIDRQHKRRLPDQIRKSADEAITKAYERGRVDGERSAKYQVERAQTLLDRMTLFKQETGIDLAHSWEGSIKRLGAAWKVANSGVDLTGLAANLTKAGAELQELLDSLKEVSE